MQTFLPYADFEQSMRVLDYRRLGKQRVEAYQLLLGQFPHHPASKMWRGYNDALVRYMNAAITEWVRRGYNNTMAKWPEAAGPDPWWLGWEPVHLSHRCNLARKDPYYKDLWPEANQTLHYIWPIGPSVL